VHRFLCFLLFVAPASATAQLRTVIEPLAPGAARTDVFFLNEGTEPLAVAPPPQLSGTRAGAAGGVLLEPEQDGEAILAPGAFIRISYRIAAAAAPPTAPGMEEAIVGTQAMSAPRPNSGTASGSFLNIEPYEPTYIIYGDASDKVKLQFSFALPLIEPLFGGRFMFAYTQTMLWAIEQPSGPFSATTYSPRGFYERPLQIGTQPVLLAVGAVHDSTGEGNRRNQISRDVNRLYVRGATAFDLGGAWSLNIAPSVYHYVLINGLGAEDIADYWGNASLEIVAEQQGGFKLAANLRGSVRSGRGAAEINASLPAQALSPRLPKFYLFAQLFTGYGESLRNYWEERTRFRIGIAFSR
jgi:phospholipase A1/A2